MSWISVHDTVDGPKLRDLYKTLNCSSFEALGILNYLWLWGLENADKDGRILNADKDDIARFLYGKGARCKIPEDKIVDALIETGWIDSYQDGTLYLHDWEVWQEQWYKAIERRESDAKRKRESRKKPTHSSAPATPKTEEKKPDVAEEQPKTAPEGQEETEKQDTAPKYTKGFEEFWKVYPRRLGKGDAYKKFQARKKDGFSEEELVLAAQNYAEECQKKKTEPQYIKHPKTFLS